VLSVIEQVIKDGRLTDDDMRRVGVEWMSPRRRWVRTFLEQLDRRLSGGAAESHGETALGDALQQAGLSGLKRQHWLDLPGYGPARLDLAIPKLRWAIEVDMFPTHLEKAGQESDRRRDEACRTIGWAVTRLDKAHFGNVLPATVDMLAREFRQRSCGESCA
jgi:very-short-patch-repair endonuclease